MDTVVFFVLCLISAAALLALFIKGFQPGNTQIRRYRGQLWRLSAKLRNGQVSVASSSSQTVGGILGKREVQVELHPLWGRSQVVDYRVRIDTRLKTVLMATGDGVPVYRQVFQPNESAERASLCVRALSDERVQQSLRKLFTHWEIERLDVKDGWLTATQDCGPGFDASNHQPTLRLLQRLTQLARAIEAVAGGLEVKATLRIKAVAKEICPYCKDALGGELGVVSCGRCETIHHADCFNELGRCTALGCGGRKAFELLRSEQGVVEPVTLDYRRCEECGFDDRGCGDQGCEATASERRKHGRRQAYERIQIRRGQHRRSSGRQRV